jgi:hypothetical protein
MSLSLPAVYQFPIQRLTWAPFQPDQPRIAVCWRCNQRFTGPTSDDAADQCAAHIVAEHMREQV